MGVKDLLRFIDEVVQAMAIETFSGCRLAVDASGWIHKAVFASAEDFIVHAIQQPTNQNFDGSNSELFVDVMVNKVCKLRAQGIEPVFVFDGRRNILKLETNLKREDNRLLHISDGRRILNKLQQANDPACISKLKNECISCFQKGLGVTHAMEKSCIAALRKLKVEVIVAPYEADPQLAYLCHIGYCKGVLSEDSDILMYSAACGTPFPILYKYDSNIGSVQVTDISKLGILPGQPAKTRSAGSKSSDDSTGKSSKLNQIASNFSNINGTRMFVQMCLLAGCDYCESIHGVGLITALQAIIRCARSANDVRLGDITAHFRLAEKKIPDNFLHRVKKAEALIYYHPVYDPNRRCIVNFQPAGGALDETSTAPRIDPAELHTLGTAEDLLREFSVFSADNHASLHMEDSLSSLPVLQVPTIPELCQGLISLKDFSVIQPCFPWDNCALRQAPTKSKEWAGRLWAQRNELIHKFGFSDKGIQPDARKTVLSTMNRSRSAPSSSSTSISTIHKWKEFTRPCNDTGPIQRAFQMNIFSGQRKSLAPRISAVSKAAAETATAMSFHPSPSSVAVAVADLQKIDNESTNGSVYVLLSDDEDSMIGPGDASHLLPMAAAEEDLVPRIPSGQLTQSLVYALLPPEEDSMAVSISDDEKDVLVTVKRTALLTSSPFFAPSAISPSPCSNTPVISGGNADAATGPQLESPPVGDNITRHHRVSPDPPSSDAFKENAKHIANTAISDDDLVDLTVEINNDTSEKRRLEEQVTSAQARKKIKSGSALSQGLRKKQPRKSTPQANRLVTTKSLSIKNYFQVSSN